MRLVKNFVLPLTLSCLGAFAAAHAQAGKAELTGSLRDQNRAAVTQERVAVTEIAIGQTYSTTVTVTHDASLLRTESGSLGQVIGNRKIVDIPLNGRNFLSLVTLSAGVAQPPPTTAGPSFPRINGGRPRTNEYLFDGISVLQPEPGQVAFFPI